MSGPYERPSNPTAAGADAAAPDRAAVRALERALRGPGTWGGVKTVVLGAASFGILPLLVWPGRFRDLAAEEARQFRTVAEWARRLGRWPAAVGPLRASAEGIEARPFLSLLPLLLGLFVAACFVVTLYDTPLTWDRLLAITYHYPAHPAPGHIVPGWSVWGPDGWQAFQWGTATRLHAVWWAGLCAAYLCHYVQVRTHAGDVRRFLASFNRVAAAEGLRPVEWPDPVWRLRPLLVAAAVGFVYFHAWWGVPMLLAAAAQRRYVTLTSRDVRAQLASRMRHVAPAREMTGPRCLMTRCQAVLPAGAAFCPRCGAAAGGPSFAAGAHAAATRHGFS